jgi:hypothetical protein
VSSTGKKRRVRSCGSWRGGRLLRVASDAAGGDQSDSELARTPLEGARGEQGGMGSAAAGRGAGRGRRRQLEVAEEEVAAGARAATAEEAAMGLVAGVAAAVRRRRPRGGRTARRRRGRRPRGSADGSPGNHFFVAPAPGNHFFVSRKPLLRLNVLSGTHFTTFLRWTVRTQWG